MLFYFVLISQKDNQNYMNDYTKVIFEVSPVNEDITDILAAMLAEVGFESFVPEEFGMSAYVQQPLFDKDAVDAVRYWKILKKLHLLKISNTALIVINNG